MTTDRRDIARLHLRTASTRLWRWMSSIAFVLVSTVVVGGCVVPHRVELSESGTPKYEKVEIVYSLKRPGTAQSSLLGQLSQQSVVPVGGVVEPNALSGFQSRWAEAQLHIEYPHPDEGPKFARATLTLAADARGEDGNRQSFSERAQNYTARVLHRTPEAAVDGREVYVLDLHRKQLDLLLVALADTGFFDHQERPYGSTHLSVQVDRGIKSKEWGTEARLDDFVDRVYRDGIRISSAAQ